MKKLLSDLLEDRDDPDEPVYDPVDFGAMLLATMTAIGALYWLLWTLFVYEGRLGNLAALALSVALIALLYRAYRDAERFASRP